MSATCRMARLRMPMMDGVDSLPGPFSRHVSSCLPCQAEQARYRRIRRGLADLASDRIDAPPTLATGVDAAMTALGAHHHRHRAGRVAAAAGAAVAAAGTVVVVRWLRARAA